MGSRSSKPEWKGYTEELLADTTEQTVTIEGSEEKNATPIRRHPEAANGFGMFATDEELKVEMQTGWDCAEVAFKRYPKCKSFGYRPFEDPENDPSLRGQYQFDDYEFTAKQVYAVANGIASLGFEPKSNIGIFSINRSEWMVAHLANWSRSYRTVALYDTLGAQAVQYIVWHGELSAIYVEKNKLPQLFEAVALCGKERELKLSVIIQFDHQERYNNTHEAVDDADVAKAEEYGIRLIGFSSLMEQAVSAGDGAADNKEQGVSAGDDAADNKEQAVSAEDGAADNEEQGVSAGDDVEDNKEQAVSAGDGAADNAGNDEDAADEKETDFRPTADDLAYIMYTSGTTGDPKGVMLTHRCFACTVASTHRQMKRSNIPITVDDAHVSYLPLAHSFESAVITVCISVGAQVAFWAGDIKTISRDWTEIRPTIMFGVPRIYNKTYDKVKLKVAAAGGAKQFLFEKAESASKTAIRKQQRSAVYDSLVWKKVAAEIGFDRVKILASGAAPLPPFVAEFLRIVCPSATVAQGYGLTETCAVSFFTAFDDPHLGHIGVPVDNIEYRLVDAPECDYRVSDQPYPRGEIQLRGPTVMSGYFKNPEATAKALADDGWFSTGDIGRINPNGTLSIIDRRKNLFKTAMGEYIASEKVENCYQRAPSVNQIWIYGNSFKSFVVAVVVPDALWLVPKLKERGLWEDEGLTPATPPYCEKLLRVCEENRSAVKELCVADIAAVVGQSDLKKFERARDFHFEFEVDSLLQGFNVGNGTLTPTFKKKRPQLLAKYVDDVKKMYAENGEPANDEENW